MCIFFKLFNRKPLSRSSSIICYLIITTWGLSVWIVRTWSYAQDKTVMYSPEFMNIWFLRIELTIKNIQGKQYCFLRKRNFIGTPQARMRLKLKRSPKFKRKLLMKDAVFLRLPWLIPFPRISFLWNWNTGSLFQYVQ